MAEYQNLFTSVQPVGPLHDGIELPRGDDKRTGTPFLCTSWVASAMHKSVPFILARSV